MVKVNDLWRCTGSTFQGIEGYIFPQKKSGSVTRISMKSVVIQLISRRNEDELAGEIFHHQIIGGTFTWFRAIGFFLATGRIGGWFNLRACRKLVDQQGQY